MKRMAMLLVAVALTGAGLVAGCRANTDYSARFLRYGTDAGEVRVAVVAPLAPAADEEQLAFTKIDDLQPGEVVYIRWVGKDWDEPQSTPEREIVSRQRRASDGETPQ